MIASHRTESPHGLLLHYGLRFRSLYIPSATALALVNLLDILLPLILKEAIDAFTTAQPEVLKLYAVLFAGVSCVQAALRFIYRMALTRMVAKVSADLRERALRRALEMPLLEIQRRGEGELTARILSDVESVANFFQHVTITLFDAFFYLLLVPVLMLWLSPWLALLALLPLPAAYLLTRLNEVKVGLRFKDAQSAMDRMWTSAYQGLTAVRAIKAQVAEQIFSERYGVESERSRDSNVALIKVESRLGPLLELVVTFSTVLVLFNAGKGVLSGAVTIGTFVAFQRYLQQLLWPLNAAGLSVASIRRSLVSASRLQEILHADSESGAGGDTSESSPADLPTDLPVGLQVKDLTFSYPHISSPAVANVNLEIKRGQRLAIVGPTGSGKSTLLALLAGLLPPSSGGVAIAAGGDYECSFLTLRSLAAYAAQMPFLFRLSIADNLEIARPDAHSDELCAALHEAAFDADLLLLPEGLQTEAGERAFNFSGGQKQRLAIARALLKSSTILILDEPVAALDGETESRLIGNLEPRRSMRIEIFTSNRLPLVKSADQIAVMESGRITALGSHADLLRESPWYAECCARQSLLKELPDE